MSKAIIRVVLADDHAVVLAGLRAILSAAPEIAIVGEARNGEEAVALAGQLDPDVLIMDLSMPGVDGAAAAKHISNAGLRTRILILTMHQEEEYLVPMLAAGAVGYLVKSVADRELVDAVRTVSGAELPVRHGPAKAGEMPAVIVDPSRAHAAGWSPRFPSLDDGLIGVWDEWSKAEVSAPVTT